VSLARRGSDDVCSRSYGRNKTKANDEHDRPEALTCSSSPDGSVRATTGHPRYHVTLDPTANPRRSPHARQGLRSSAGYIVSDGGGLYLASRREPPPDDR